MYKLLTLSFLFIFSFAAFGQNLSQEITQEERDQNSYLRFIGSSTKVKRKSPLEVNNYISDQVEMFQNSKNFRVVEADGAFVIFPLYKVRNIDGTYSTDAATVIKFSEPKGSKKDSWNGAEKVYISKSGFGGNNWSMKSGGKHLRNDPAVLAAIDDLGKTSQDIDWKRDRNDVIFDQMACIKTSCEERYQYYNDVTCKCEDRIKECSEEKRTAERKKCKDLKASNSQILAEYRVMTYSFNESRCKCIKDKLDPPPGGGLKCAKDPIKLREKRSDCTKKNDLLNNKYFSFDIKSCKCEKTKMLCGNKYWDKTNHVNLTTKYENDKAACLSVKTNKWIDCGCISTLGDKLCRYKEVRKIVGKFAANKAVFTIGKTEDNNYQFNKNGERTTDFADEKDEVRTDYGPCGMEDWLKNKGSDKKQIQHCKTYEKLKIKGTAFSSNERFNTKKYFCIACKHGYKEITSVTSIDGINDDAKLDINLDIKINSMEQPSYKYVTSCQKTKNKCYGERFKRKKDRCNSKNNINNLKKGLTYTWDDQECKCKNHDDVFDDIPPKCIEKVSKRKINRCYDRDGEFDEETCKCTLPTPIKNDKCDGYDRVVDTDEVETGKVTCDFDQTAITSSLQATDLSEKVNGAIKENCQDLILGDDGTKSRDNGRSISFDDIEKECAKMVELDPSLISAEKGVSEKKVKVTFEISRQVTCSVTSTNKNSGFADKIPGLVGGLDLENDFLYKGKKITDPSQIDCDKGITYKPKNVKSAEGKYKSSVTGDKCKNVIDMYNSIKGDANSFVKSIWDMKGLTDDKKLELIKENFKADVTATANRVGHPAGYANHDDLSERRANSMSDFYINQVVSSIPEGVNTAGLFDTLKEKSKPDTIAYFGPQYASSNSTFKKMSDNKTDPVYKEAKDNFPSLTTKEENMTKSEAIRTGNTKVLGALKQIYNETIKHHINVELNQLEHNESVANNFSNSIMNNDQFKAFAGDKISGTSLYENIDLYEKFLQGQFNKSNKDQNEFLDTMKIFDISAASSFTADNKETVIDTDTRECKMNYEDRYKLNPVMKDVSVHYAKRPGFVERFKKECRDEYKEEINELIGEIDKKLGGTDSQLYKDLYDRYEDASKAKEKYYKKVRKMAKKQWRFAKYNTRSVAKDNENGVHRRWNRPNGDHNEKDGKTNFTQTYDHIKNEIQPNPADTWSPGDHKYKTMD